MHSLYVITSHTHTHTHVYCHMSLPLYFWQTGAVDTIPPTQQTEVTPKVEPGTEGEGPMLDKPKSDSKDVKSQSKPSILDLLDNTTANHGSHVFDHRCDICMGKVTPPTLPPPPPPPPTSLQPPSPLTPPPVQTDTSSASTPDRLVWVWGWACNCVWVG